MKAAFPGLRSSNSVFCSFFDMNEFLFVVGRSLQLRLSVIAGNVGRLLFRRPIGIFVSVEP